MLSLPLLLAALVGGSPAPFELKDGDRVVFLGNGFVERDPFHGYFETRLTRRFPVANIVFRNLGWSGDTVRGNARVAGFKNPDGFARLLKEVGELKPSVLFIGYGQNESFAGADGLAGFVADYQSLLAKLKPLKARLILMSPTHHEDLGRPFPDPSTHNRDLRLYADAIRDLARENDAIYIDLFEPLRRASTVLQLTTNGILLNDLGYAHAASVMEEKLGFSPFSPVVELDAAGKVVAAQGVKPIQTKAEGGGLDLRLESSMHGVLPESLTLTVSGLPAGRYALSRDEKPAGFVTIKDGKTRLPIALADGEKLRDLIVKKNELFYRRWRPFNDHSRHWTYIGGDFKLYDDQIAALEKSIAEARKPSSIRVKITPAGDSK